jgi:hypothetical protein
MWTRPLGAVFLVLSAGPALASDGSGASPAARDRADVDRAAPEVRDLSSRLSSLERRVAELESARPTRGGEVKGKIEQERRAEFLQRVWTDG